MKVVCVSRMFETISIGNIYDVDHVNPTIEDKKPYMNTYYWIKHDDGKHSWVISTCFISLDEYRQNQLNKVL